MRKLFYILGHFRSFENRPSPESRRNPDTLKLTSRYTPLPPHPEDLFGVVTVRLRLDHFGLGFVAGDLANRSLSRQLPEEFVQLVIMHRVGSVNPAGTSSAFLRSAVTPQRPVFPHQNGLAGRGGEYFFPRRRDFRPMERRVAKPEGPVPRRIQQGQMRRFPQQVRLPDLRSSKSEGGISRREGRPKSHPSRATNTRPFPEIFLVTPGIFGHSDPRSTA